MKDELVSFEVAKLAKEKGFNIPCRSKYTVMKTKRKFTTNSMLSRVSTKDNVYAVPTLSLLQRWLREKHNIHIHLEYIGEGSYYIEATNFDSEVNIFMDNLYGTYEDILNVILEISLETIN